MCKFIETKVLMFPSNYYIIDQYILQVSTSENGVPERMYKLVLAGDAAVGKSSFILRLCRNRFHNALNSTLGRYNCHIHDLFAGY